MGHYKERARKSTFIVTGSHLTCEWWEIKDLTDMASACSNFFMTITEKLNIQQREKGDAISVLKDSFPGILLSIKIIPITEIKSIIHSLKPKKSSGYETTSKILKAYASPSSHPLSYNYNHLLYTGIFPDCLKISVAKPLYKKGDKTSMTNYRLSHY